MDERHQAKFLLIIERNLPKQMHKNVRCRVQHTITRPRLQTSRSSACAATTRTSCLPQPTRRASSRCGTSLTSASSSTTRVRRCDSDLHKLWVRSLLVLCEWIQILGFLQLSVFFNLMHISLYNILTILKFKFNGIKNSKGKWSMRFSQLYTLGESIIWELT